MEDPQQDTHEALQLPLAELIRPKRLADYIGQGHLVNSANGEITNFLRLGYLPSMILCGPPGVGKTSLARLLAGEANYVFLELSATDSSMDELKDLVCQLRGENGTRLRRGSGRLRVVIFIDEIHRFTSVQQDFLLSFIESGDFVFIGATTLESRKRIRHAIMSRCQVFRLHALDEHDVYRVIQRAVLFQNIKRKRCQQLKFLRYSDDAMASIAKYATGDLRTAVNVVELMSSRYENGISKVGECDPPSVTVQDARLLIKDLHKTRVDSLHSSSSCFISRMFAAIEAATPQGLERASRTTKAKQDHAQSAHALNSSPVRQNLLERGPVVEEAQSLQSKWDLHIPFSDDSDIEPEADNEKLAAADLDYHLARAMECALIVLQNGESPLFIIKSLILYACRWPPGQEALLIELVSAFKSLQHSNSDPRRLVATCIENLVRRIPTKERLDTAMQLAEKYISIHERGSLAKQKAQDVALNVTFDDSLVQELLSTPVCMRGSPPPVQELLSLQQLPAGCTIGASNTDEELRLLTGPAAL